jgi:2-methylcitrate dehydratase
MALHGEVRDKVGEDGFEQIERIELETQEAGLRIIDKTGPLANYADRDHCLQYMVAVPLIFGRLTAGDYDDAIAADPRIDMLRDRMVVRENPRFTADYYDPGKRYIGNSVQVFFKDGTSTARVSIDYPVGHRRRRAQGIPLLMAKFEAAIAARLPAANVDRLLALAARPERMDAMPVTQFMGLSRIHLP